MVSRVGFESFLPLVTLVIGILGTLVVEWLRGRDARSREFTARSAARAQSIEDRRRDFELDTLTEVHKQLHRLGRAATRYHMLDRSVAIASQVDYASHRLGGIAGESELGEELRLANRDLSTASSLILNDELRDNVVRATNELNRVGRTTRSVDEADKAFDAATMEVGAAQEMIAHRIREIYSLLH
jgi:hypothetical protein